MLDVTEFTIAMFFVQKLMTGTIKTPPANLPPGFYEMAAGTNTAIIANTTTSEYASPASPPFTPRIIESSRPGISPLMRQNSLSIGGSASPIFSDDSWDVSSEDKATYDRYFDSLDKRGKGLLQGMHI